MTGLLVNDYSQRNPPTLGEAMSGLLGNWGSNIEQGLLSALPVLAENDPYKIGQQLLREGAGVGGIAWHGSPHKFTRPDLSKIGTGEGAQAYGHGLYTAENPKVAKEYADELTREIRVGENIIQGRGKTIGTTGIEDVDDYLIADRGDASLALSNMKKDRLEIANGKYPEAAKHYDSGIEMLEELVKKGGVQNTTDGNLYKVDIPDDQIAKMLDWDKPLSEQPKEIMDAVDRALPQSKRDSLAKLGYLERDDYTKFNEGRTIAKQLGSMTGKDVEVGFGRDVRNSFGADADNYRRIAQDGDKTKNYQSVVAELLRQQGIPGIKYLDQGSRSGGQGTSNFVLFSDEIAKILERNDQPIGELAEMLSSGKKVKP